MTIKINPRKALVKILHLILFLLIMNLAGLISRVVLEQEFVYDLRPLFDFDVEMNIPTFFSSMALLFASILLSVIAWIQRKLRSGYLHWLGLALIFLFLTIDEFAELHERLILPIRAIFHTSGYLYFSWIIPYGVAFVLITLVYFNFLIRLPRETGVMFCFSAALYVGGAIGFEMLGGKHYEIFGPENLTYGLLYTSEELLEMVGIALFIYSLLSYIANQFPDLTVCFDGPA